MHMTSMQPAGASPDDDLVRRLAEAISRHLRPARVAWTKDEAAARLGVTVSWLEEMARRKRIPYTLLSGSYHFTDEHLATIVKAFEVLPRAAAPAPAAAAPVKRARASRQPGPGAAQAEILTARPPRKRSAA